MTGSSISASGPHRFSVSVLLKRIENTVSIPLKQARLTSRLQAGCHPVIMLHRGGFIKKLPLGETTQNQATAHLLQP